MWHFWELQYWGSWLIFVLFFGMVDMYLAFLFPHFIMNSGKTFSTSNVHLHTIEDPWYLLFDPSIRLFLTSRNLWEIFGYDNLFTFSYSISSGASLRCTIFSWKIIGLMGFFLYILCGVYCLGGKVIYFTIELILFYWCKAKDTGTLIILFILEERY